MSRLSRPTALKIAALLTFALATFGIVLGIPLLAQDATTLNDSGPPYFVVVADLIFSILLFAAIYSLWQRQRWAIVLTIVVSTLSAIIAVPGILFAPINFFRVASAISVILHALIVVLCLWRERNPERV